jgi:hypothetical protein
VNERKKLANDIIKCLKMPVLNENFRKIAFELQYIYESDDYFYRQLQSAFSEKDDSLTIVDEPIELLENDKVTSNGCSYKEIAKFLISNMDMGTICDFDDETHCRAIYSGLEKCPMIACYIASYLKKSHFQ